MLLLCLVMWEWTKEFKGKSSGLEMTKVEAILMSVQVRVRIFRLVKCGLQDFLLEIPAKILTACFWILNILLD